MIQRHQDITDQRFGRLIAIRRVEKPKHITKGRDSFWLCQCDCGNIHVIRARSLKHGETRSCGCLNTQVRQSGINQTTHGMSRTKEYHAWNRMLARCYNPKTDTFKYYGGRGIKVCKQWRNSFAEFFKYTGKAPTSKYSLDRIDNNGDYEPGNVKWSTASEQQRNRRDRRLYTFSDKTQLLIEWAEDTGIHIATLHSRIKRGWSIERTLTTDPKAYHNR